MAARRPLLLLLALGAPPLLLRGAAAQCSAGQSVGNEDDCNIFARYDVQYTRSFPTWVFMGMPLAILADLDTDVRIVERTDVDTKHCFTHCDCYTGAPRGYELHVASTTAEKSNGGDLLKRSRGACSCHGEGFKEYEFKEEACSVNVQLSVVSGAGDSKEMSGAEGGFVDAGEADGDIVDLEEKAATFVVGLWDPQGTTTQDGLSSNRQQNSGGRGRRLSASGRGGGGIGAATGTAGRGGERQQRRRMDEDMDGFTRAERFLAFPSQEYREDSDYEETDDELLNPYTQSPRGTLAIALGADSVAGIRDHLKTLENLPSDAVTSAAARPLAALSTLLLGSALLVSLARNAPGWLTVTLLLLAIPLAAATHVLCGCGRRAEVVISVPRGFTFSRFEFSGAGRVACSSCDGPGTGDYSNPSAPYVAEDPADPTPVNSSDTVFTARTAKYFDPRYFMARPLVFESTATQVHVLIEQHGHHEVEHSHDASWMGQTTTPPWMPEDNHRDGETSLFDEKGKLAGIGQVYDDARSSYVSLQAHVKPHSDAKINFLPTAEAFTVEVGASVVESSSSTRTTSQLLGASRLSAGAVVAMMVATMQLSPASRWAAMAVLCSATVVWAQHAAADVVVVLSMPRGLCLPEIVGVDGVSVTCPDCAAWTCPSTAASPGNSQSAAAAESDAGWMAALKTQWSDFVQLNKSTCPLGGFDAPVFARGAAAAGAVHDWAGDLQLAAGVLTLADNHTAGCIPCGKGHWMHTRGEGCSECLYTSRCAGNNICNFNFTGKECGVCKPGFYQEEEDDDHEHGSCSQCPEPTVLGYALFGLGIACTVGVFVLMTVKGAVVGGMEDQAAEVQEATDVLRQTLTYLQALVLLFGSEALTVPEFMVEIKEKIKSVAFVNIAQILDAKMPSDCVFQGNYATAPTEAANMLSGAEAGGILNATEPLDEAAIYWKRFGAQQFLFWCVFGVCCLMGVVFHFCEVKKTHPILPNFTATATSTPLAIAGTMYSTLYITLLSSAARTWDCTDDADGVSRLDDFPDIICWEGKHTKFQWIGLFCTFFFISIWVWVSATQYRLFHKWSGADKELTQDELDKIHANATKHLRDLFDTNGDGELDDEEMKKVKAAEQLENMDKKTLKHKMEEKGLDSSGIRKRTLVKRICLSQNPEHDPVRLLEELGGTTSHAKDSEVQMNADVMWLEMAEYFKKTVLVIVVVLFTTHPKWSYVMMCIGYLVYFKFKVDTSDAIDSDDGCNCMKYKLIGTEKPTDSDEDRKSWLAYYAELWQIVGETTFVLCSLYFANNEEHEQGGFWYVVVMIPICVVNGVAALITFGYVFVFWKGWCSKCKENPCWVAKAATEAAATQVEAVSAEIAKTMSSTEKTYEAPDGEATTDEPDAAATAEPGAGGEKTEPAAEGDAAAPLPGATAAAP